MTSVVDLVGARIATALSALTFESADGTERYAPRITTEAMLPREGDEPPPPIDGVLVDLGYGYGHIRRTAQGFHLLVNWWTYGSTTSEDVALAMVPAWFSAICARELQARRENALGGDET